jgi:DNA-binding transcriptional LysR family regulator
MDRLTSLTVFGQVVDRGGFSAAGRHLNMSVTMVSNHVQALEDRLGVRLLNRTTRKVSLTDIGKEYYERSRQILADLDEADQVAGFQQATPQGQLRVHTSASLVRFLSPVAGEFLTKYPKVSIDLTVGERMIDLVEDGYDLAIRTLPPPDSSLVVRRLTAWRHVLCCAPAYLEKHAAPTQPSDLAQHNCLRYAFYPFGAEWRFEAPGGAIVSVPITGNLMTNGPEMLRLMALAGHGLCLAPTFLIADDLADGSLVPLIAGYRPLEFSINAIYVNRTHLPAKIRGFIDLLAEGFAEHRKWMNPEI